MNRLLAVLLCAFTLGLTASVALAQYDFLDPQEAPKDTAQVAPDSANASADSVKAPPKRPNPYGLEEEETVEDAATTPAESVPEEEGVLSGPRTVVDRANLWVRRLLFRGQLSTLNIGGYAQYQLTNWAEGVGSYGPVQARVVVYYLGTSEWLGNDAEWLQVSFNTMGEDPGMIEYDLLVPSATDIDQIYRSLYRVDGGPLQAVTLTMPEGAMDYDVMDNPVEDGSEEMEIFFGTFQTARLRGSGTNGAEVVLYMDSAVPPLGIVRMGYGEEALTLTDHGSDARPRFYSPPPPRGQAVNEQR